MFCTKFGTRQSTTQRANNPNWSYHGERVSQSLVWQSGECCWPKLQWAPPRSKFCPQFSQPNPPFTLLLHVLTLLTLSGLKRLPPSNSADHFLPIQTSVSLLSLLTVASGPLPPPPLCGKSHQAILNKLIPKPPGTIHGSPLSQLQPVTVLLQGLDAVPDLAPHFPQLEEGQVPFGLLNWNKDIHNCQRTTPLWLPRPALRHRWHFYVFKSYVTTMLLHNFFACYTWLLFHTFFCTTL